MEQKLELLESVKQNFARITLVWRRLLQKLKISDLKLLPISTAWRHEFIFASSIFAPSMYECEIDIKMPLFAWNSWKGKNLQLTLKVQMQTTEIIFFLLNLKEFTVKIK